MRLQKRPARPVPPALRHTDHPGPQVPSSPTSNLHAAGAGPLLLGEAQATSSETTRPCRQGSPSRESSRTTPLSSQVLRARAYPRADGIPGGRLRKSGPHLVHTYRNAPPPGSSLALHVVTYITTGAEKWRSHVGRGFTSS